MTAAILVPVVGFAVADSVQEESWEWVDIGPLRDFPEGKTTSLAVSGPDPEADRRAYVRHQDGAIIAIWNRCAHLGCPVAYSPGGDVYACPCHGGAYDSLGLVTSGPPPRPLDRFDVKVVGADGKDLAAQEVPATGCPTRRLPPEARLLLGRPFSIDADPEPLRAARPGRARDRRAREPLPPLGRRRGWPPTTSDPRTPRSRPARRWFDYVDERSGVKTGFKWFLFRNVPAETSWFQTLGFTAMALFGMQAVTGIILAMYYQPTPTTAYQSIDAITHDVTWGWLVRGMHKWGASAMIVVVFLHLGPRLLLRRRTSTRAS